MPRALPSNAGLPPSAASSGAEIVDATAKGMIGSFGADAERRAGEMARRWAARHNGAAEALWLAVARRITEIRPKARVW